MPETVENFLAHYGVPGMRWGKRKSGGRSLGRVVSPDGTTSNVRTNHKKTVHLTDNDLKDRISRIKLENEYLQLIKPKPSAGQKFIRAVLAESGKKVATEYVTKLGTKAVASAIAKSAATNAAKAVAKGAL